MRRKILIICMISFVMVLYGCVNAPGESEIRQHSNTGEMTEPTSDEIIIEGNIVYNSIEGGFYVIEGDDGKTYSPINLSESFKKDGIKVSVTARLKRDVMSVRMHGILIEILNIKKAASK